MRSAAPPAQTQPRPPLGLFDPEAVAGFMAPAPAPVQDPDQLRADRRRVHPAHAARLDPNRPPGPPAPSSLVDPHPDDAPWWAERYTIDDGETVWPILLFTCRRPPVEQGLDVRRDADGTYLAIRLGRPRPSTLFAAAAPGVGPAA